MTHEVEIAAKEFRADLESYDGVLDVQLSEPRPALLLFTVAIKPGNEAARRAVLDAINGFHSQHVNQVSVDVEIEETGADEYAIA